MFNGSSQFLIELVPDELFGGAPLSYFLDPPSGYYTCWLVNVNILSFIEPIRVGVRNK